MGDAVIRHGIIDAAGINRAQEDMAAGQHRDRPGETPAVAMEHRQGPEINRKMRHLPAQGVVDCIEIRPAVAVDHLGIACCAGGITDSEGIPFIGRRAVGKVFITFRQQVS